MMEWIQSLPSWAWGIAALIAIGFGFIALAKVLAWAETKIDQGFVVVVAIFGAILGFGFFLSEMLPDPLGLDTREKALGAAIIFSAWMIWSISNRLDRMQRDIEKIRGTVETILAHVDSHARDNDTR